MAGHDHNQEHDHPHHNHSHPVAASAEPLPLDRMDAAGRSLAEALRISFVVLKVIMLVVGVAFLASGIQTIGPEEQGLVLRFGKIQPVDPEGGLALKPGLTWVLPYPIHELVKIPVEKRINMSVNSFWYFQTVDEILGNKKGQPQAKLNPLTEGYSLTRGEGMTDLVDRAARGVTSDEEGSDYNIVHSRWQIVYQIRDLAKFFQRVYVQDPKPGEVYYDLMTKSLQPLLQSCVEGAVVKALVHYSIDEAIVSKDRIPKHVQRLVQETLDRMDCGIQVQTVTLTDFTWPRQVDDAFNAFITASQDRQTKIDEARTYSAGLLNRAEGQARQVEGQAQAYRIQVVEAARSQKDYFERLLPEYRQRPQLVLQNLYIDALQEVLKNADEKFFMQPSAPGEDREVRVMINSDPAMKTKAGGQSSAKSPQ